VNKKEIPLAQQILFSAERFWKTACVLSLKMQSPYGRETEHGQWIQPRAAMQILALELYLKTISQIENNEYSRQHDLVKLFQTLSVESQKSIRRKYDLAILEDKNFKQLVRAIENEAGKKIKLDFFSQLKEMRKGFEEFRYIFDNDSQKGTMAVAYLRNALVDRIDEIGDDIHKQVEQKWVDPALKQR